MYVRLSKLIRFSAMLFVCLFILSTAGMARNSSPGVKLYTPYSSISVPPGQTINYSIQVINHSSAIENVGLAVWGLPKGWSYTMKSGSWNISKVSVLPDKNENLALQITVPLRVNKGAYHFEVAAKGFTVLPLTVIVSKKGTYKTTFTTPQANLEGAANSTFTFNTSLENATADTQLYALNAEAPPGWNVTFKANYKEVASVNVPANHTQKITVTIKAPDHVAAGTYKIPVYATTNTTSAGLALETVVTGSYSMDLSTPDGLLNTDITAGDQKRIALTVKNTGSAPLKKISFHFTAPTNWDISFDPKQIDELPAGHTEQIFATIRADKDAIAGDYATDLKAQTPETTANTELRVSVTTPLLWGWVGILIILVAVGSVYFLFRKYGRR